MYSLVFYDLINFSIFFRVHVYDLLILRWSKDGQGQRPAFNWSPRCQLQALLLLLSWWQADLQPEACKRGRTYRHTCDMAGGANWQATAREIWLDMWAQVTSSESNKEKKRHTVTLFVFLFFCYILINPNLYVSICWRPAFESLCTPLISDSSMTFAVFKQSHAATLLHAQNGSECLTTSHATLIVRFRCFFSRSCQDAKLYKESGHLVQTWRVYLRFMFFQH